MCEGDCLFSKSKWKHTVKCIKYNNRRADIAVINHGLGVAEIVIAGNYACSQNHIAKDKKEAFLKISIQAGAFPPIPENKSWYR